MGEHDGHGVGLFHMLESLHSRTDEKLNKECGSTPSCWQTLLLEVQQEAPTQPGKSFLNCLAV